MSEKDIQGTIIPFRPTNKPRLPSQVIDLTSARVAEPPSTIIVFSEEDDRKQFGITAEEYAKTLKIEGIPMPLKHIANATRDTGGIAAKVAPELLPPEVKPDEFGVIRNSEGIPIAVAGEDRVIRMYITSLNFPTNPFTGQQLNPPVQRSEVPTSQNTTAKLLQFPQPQTQPAAESRVTQSSNEMSELDAARADSPFLNKRTA